MKIVMLSQDMKALEPGPTAERLASYGRVFDEVVFVVFGPGSRRERILAKNVRAFAPGGKGKLSAFFRGVGAAVRMTHELGADVVSAQDPFFIGLAGLITARRARRPLQVQVHTDPFSAGFRRGSLRRRIESALAPLLLRSASCVRAVSERVARSIRAHTKAPVSVLPIFPPLTISGTAPVRDRSGRSFSILSVSRLAVEKQLFVAIDAMREVSGAVLTIVGDGPLRAALEARVRDRGVDDRVRFVGWHDDVSFFFENADAFLSLSAYEGYGRSLIEAALRGLPIVTTNVGVVGEVLRPDEDVLVVLAEPDHVAGALTRLVEDGALAHQLGENARARARAHVVTEAEYLARYREAMHTCIP